MNKQDAILFLTDHQPMPPDTHLSDAVLIEYDEVRELFLGNPDRESIPLLLNSFGDGIGGGVYQLVEHVILKHKSDVVLPHLLQALASPHRSVRYWCAQIAAVFPHPDLIAPLAVHLAQADDFDMRYAAVTALEQIRDARSVKVLRDALDREQSEEIRELIKEVLA